MARSVKKRRRSQSPMEYFIFEIKKWEPSYSLSVNQDRHREAPYREYLNIRLEGACIHPEKLAARSVEFYVAAERDQLAPEIYKRDPDWIPKCIGLLTLPPSGGRFYAAVPFDSFTPLLTALAHNLLCFIVLWGPALSRGKSLCQSIDWVQALDPEGY